MLQEFKKGEKEHSIAYKQLMKEAIGKDVSVKLIRKKEFKDLDETTTTDEIISAINK